MTLLVIVILYNVKYQLKGILTRLNYVNTNLWKYSGGILTNPSLTIKNVQLSDAANYVCHLSTSFGNSNDSVDLKVLCK
jgi:hypothetical protein